MSSGGWEDEICCQGEYNAWFIRYRRFVQASARCGSVYVNADDTARRVTQAAVCSTAVAEKKRRAGKYTVAVGTSHGHVQAFLEDGDNVLDTLERCQAEDKCLMLIKRPKESARKMLKSHSLTQMSVSDPQLYRQFNGMQLTQVHQHAQTVSPTHQDEQLETQSTTSNSTEGTDPRHRYATVKDRLLKQPPPQYSGARRPADYYRSDPCSNSNDVYQYLPRRGDHRDPCRRDLRYSSIPEDEDQEINNNQLKGSSSPDSTSPCHYSNRGHFVRHDQSPNHTPSNRHDQRHSQSRCPPTYDQLRNGPALSSQNERSSQVLSAHDSSGDIGGVDTRTQSGTSQPSGLTTFSLVGQRKAAGVTFSSPTAQRHLTNRQGPGEGDHYWDTPGSADVAARSHNRYMTNGLSPSSSKVSAPGCSIGSSSEHHSGGMPISPSLHHRQHASNGDQHRQYVPNGDVGESPRGKNHQYSNGHAYSHGSSAPLQGHSQKVMSPLRIRTNMPPAPASVSESSERLKRFTEVMRCRTSVSSCGDMSTTSSLSHTPTTPPSRQSSVTPHTPPSRQSSTTDNGWDSEVSTLLEVRLGDGGDSSPSHKRTSDAREKAGTGKQGCESGKAGHLNCPDKTANSSSSQETPNLCDQHSDGGQTSFTSHSHSSTMDSGYTTNTEGEGDSSLNHLSPPYHPSFPHHHHHHPVHTPHVQPEPYRPVPMPRNLFPTSARKCNSLHGSSSTQHSPGHSAHPEGKSRAKSSPSSSSSSQQKRAVSQCIQINGHPVDKVVHAQRSGGWNSAPSFKSLDYSPAVAAGGGRAQVDTAGGSSGEDLVLKPQVVARSCVDSPASPSRVHDAENKPDAGGEAGSSSSTEQTTPSSLPPPPPPESNSVITVPGQWNHHNTNNNGNAVNNNAAASANGVFLGSPRSQPRPPVKATPIPTLFQVSQSHDLCSARLVTPGSLCASSLVTLTSVQVTFPSLNAENGSASQSPQGHCARIGGPGSAFRPVRAGSTSQTTDLTAVEAVDDQCRQYVTVGELQSGDLLLEVNGWQCMGQDTAGIQSLLDTTQDVTLVVARKRQETQRSNNNRVQELESSVQKLEEEVGRLSEDLSQKDARIQELSSLLPWTQDQQTGETTLILQSEDDAFVIGENEFVV